MITINVKTSTDGKYAIEVQDPATTSVLDFKTLIAAQSSIPVDQQRLIYSGKVLKDADMLSQYKIETGHTVHLVKGGSAPKPASASSTPAAAAPAPSSSPTSRAAPSPAAANPLAGMFGMPGAGAGANPFAAAGGAAGANPFGNPMMQQMMQQMLGNPQMLQGILASNPMFSQMGITPEQLQQTMQDPMFAAMLSNPQLLQSAMAMGGMGGMPGMAGMGMSGMPGANTTGAAASPQGQAAAGARAAGTQPTSPNSANPQLPPLPGPFMNPFMMNPMLSQMLAGAGGAAAPQNQDPPVVRFQTQLQQLQDMGFFDASQNIRALMATGGNVNAAVEFLLRQ